MCSYSVAVATENEKEVTDYEHVIESFVCDFSSQPTSSKYDIIVTSSVACCSLDHVLGSLKDGGFLVLLCEEKVDLSAGEIVASRECEFAQLYLIRNKRQQV